MMRLVELRRYLVPLAFLLKMTWLYFAFWGKKQKKRMKQSMLCINPHYFSSSACRT